jgi:putative ABC transport system permease protein
MGLSDEVHTLLVLLDETERTNDLRQILAARLGISKRGLELKTWEEAGDYYRQSKAMLDRIFTVIQLIVCIVFFFSIANTLNMALHERIREFGTMMAIGNGRPTIFGVILLEASFMGLLGAVLGLLVGAGTAHAVSAMGIEMPPPPNGSNPYAAMISLSEPLLWRTFLISFGSTIVSAIPPAFRFCRCPIVEALGYV